MLKLAKTEVSAMTQQRVVRLGNDVLRLSHLTDAEIRAVYGDLLAIRNALSEMLAKAEAGHED